MTRGLPPNMSQLFSTTAALAFGGGTLLLGLAFFLAPTWATRSLSDCWLGELWTRLGVGVAVGAVMLAHHVGSPALTRLFRTPQRSALAWLQHWKVVCSERSWSICGLLLLLEASRHALSPEGLKAHQLELGIHGLEIAVLGLVWVSYREHLSNGSLVRPAATHPTAVRLGIWGLGFLAAFLLLTLAVDWVEVQSVDVALGELFYRCGSREVTLWMKRISNAGGRDLVVYWIPLAFLTMWLMDRGRRLPFFVVAMFGTAGLQSVFKTLVQRQRPAFVGKPHFDSFPSGHTLAATVFAGALLLVLLPHCRHTWQRGLLWSAAITWPIFEAASRVYLGRHYVTDVIAGWLLGIAWICLCQSMLVRFVPYQMGGTCEAK